MSGLANARKNFRYLLELDGSNAFQVQEVQPPVLSYPVLKHGAPVNIPDFKSPGKMEVGELIVKKLLPALSADTWAHDWFAQGIAGIMGPFMKVGFLKHLGPDGFSVVETFFLGNVWPSKIECGPNVSMGPGENLIQTVTFQVQIYTQVNSAVMHGLLSGSAAPAGGAGFAAGFNG